MITPTRLGLKYAPVPTLALEYEDDLSSAEGAGATSLYVFRGEEPGRRVKKLHVVELPTLTRASETRRIVEQLQRDNNKFLSPSVVNESQLKRLLDLLVEHLEAVGGATEPMPPSAGAPINQADSAVGVSAPEHEDDEEEQDEIDESFVVESMAELSQALESSEAPSDHQPVTRSVEKPAAVPASSEAPSRGMFLSEEENESEDERGQARDEVEGKSEERKTPVRGERDEDDGYDNEQYDSPDKPVASSNVQASQSEAATADEMDKQQDEKDEEEKKKALKSDSEVSEEDIQSEELEYFSEDGSDEDSF